MEQIRNYRIEQCLNDIQNYEKWGNLLAGQCVAQFSGANTSASASIIHNGLEYFKAKMKLFVLQDTTHTDEEKDRRLNQIDLDIHHTEEAMKYDLKYRGVLIP